LIVAAMGIEVAIAAANFRLGRALWLANSAVYLCGLVLKSQKMLGALDANPAVLTIYHVVGLCSAAAYFWFAILTKETFAEFCLDASEAACFLLLVATPGLGLFCLVLAAGAGFAWFKFARDTWKLGNEWLVVLVCGLCWVVGAAFYFYMPLAGMTNPPIQWGYPREVGGFIHAFTRGQYEKTNPSDIFGDPKRFIMQLTNMLKGVTDEFNWVCSFLVAVPFVFFRKLHRRERAWLIGITAIYLCLAVLLMILLNPSPDRAAAELNRVFFTASHTLVSLLVGYGLTLIAAYMATHYERFRMWGLIGGVVAVGLAIYSFVDLTTTTFFGEDAKVPLSELLSFTHTSITDQYQYAVPVYAGLILIGLAVAFVVALLLYSQRAPLAISLVIFALLPVHSIMTHWADNEQRGHYFGYWFGHDMFTPPFNGPDGKPLYPEMTKDAVLFGGTDPGRFCPTYMIFCDSFTPSNCLPSFDQKFDRRDVYIITQNALADGTYLEYIRAQFNRSAQIDQPFFREFFRTILNDKEYQTNILARLAAPLDTFFTGLGDRIEMRRKVDTSWFQENHFSDPAGFAARLRSSPTQDPLSKYLYDNLSKETQQLLAGSDEKALRRALAKDLNVLLERELKIKKAKTAKMDEKAVLDEDLATGSESASKRRRQQELEKEIAELNQTGPLYTPDRFKDVKLSEYITDFI
jgi:hypothetical protein